MQQQEVARRTAEKVAAGQGYLVTIIGDDSLVFHGEEGRESVTVLDDAVGYVLADRWQAARPEQTVVVFVGGDPAPVQLIVEKRRLERVAINDRLRIV
jgi:hypothetical protein